MMGTERPLPRSGLMNGPRADCTGATGPLPAPPRSPRPPDTDTDSGHIQVAEVIDVFTLSITQDAPRAAAPPRCVSRAKTPSPCRQPDTGGGSRCRRTGAWRAPRSSRRQLRVPADLPLGARGRTGVGGQLFIVGVPADGQGHAEAEFVAALVALQGPAASPPPSDGPAGANGRRACACASTGRAGATSDAVEPPIAAPVSHLTPPTTPAPPRPSPAVPALRPLPRRSRPRR